MTNIFKKLEGWYVNYILAEGMYTELRICEIQSNLATVRMFANFVASNLNWATLTPIHINARLSSYLNGAHIKPFLHCHGFCGFSVICLSAVS